MNDHCDHDDSWGTGFIRCIVCGFHYDPDDTPMVPSASGWQCGHCADPQPADRSPGLAA